MSSGPVALAAPPLRDDVHTISLVSLVHLASHFSQLMLPPLFPWVAAGFGVSNTQLGALVSVYFVVSGFGQALAGFVVDRHGADRVLFGGLALLAVAALGLGASPNYAVMMVFAAVAGLGNCVFHPVDYSILNARVHASRLGPAYAAHGICGSLGWAVAPAFMVAVATLSSWRWALVAAGLAVTAVLALAVWQRGVFVVERHAERAGGRAGVGAGAGAGTAAFLRLPAVWACFAFFLIFAAALGGIQTFAPAAAGQLFGISPEQVALCLSAFMLAGAAGMVLGGQLVRDVRRSAMVAALGFGSAALIALAIGLLNWPPALVPVLCGAMGFAAGIAGPSRDLLVKEATPAGATGRVYGVVYSGLDVGLTITPLVFGALMDAGRYREVWFGVAALYAVLIAAVVRVRRAAPAGRAAAGARAVA